MTLYGLRALNGKWGHLFLGTIAPIGKRSPVEAGSRRTIAGGAQHTLLNTNITTGESYTKSNKHIGGTPHVPCLPVFINTPGFTFHRLTVALEQFRRHNTSSTNHLLL